MQLVFDFPSQEQYSPEDFIISSANHYAFNFISNYNPGQQNLPKIFTLLAPKSAGKTYLANIWQKKFNAEFLNLGDLENTDLIKFIKDKKFYIIEDIDQIKNQKLLLQIFNLITEKSAHLMLTTTTNLHQINFTIKDLSSRLKNVFEIEIKKPDDNFIKMILIKNFATKQLKVSNQVIEFLTKNLPRNFAEIFDTVKLLEFYSLKKKKNITIPLIKEVMKQNQTIDL